MNPFTQPSGWNEIAEVEYPGSPTIYTTLVVGYKEMPAAGATGQITVTSEVPLSDGWIGVQLAVDEALTPITMRAKLHDATGATYADGTAVYAYNSDGTLYQEIAVGDVYGYRKVDVTAADAGEVVLSFKPGTSTSKFFVVDPAEDANGLVTNLITPA